MLDYKLAKQLKDAGYPMEYYEKAGAAAGVIPNFPTLSELIEACGEEIEVNNCKDILRSVSSRSDWLARKHYGIKKPPHLAQGKTPEEAVAKLWLALNK